jgi:hypothetical protein
MSKRWKTRVRVCRARTRVLVITAVSALSVPYLIGPAQAFACATGRTDLPGDPTSWFDGRLASGAYSRVDATIVEKSPDPTGGTEVLSWTALQSLSSGGTPNGNCQVSPGCIVQTGWTQLSSGAHNVFYEGFTGGLGNFFKTYGPGQALNTNTVYSTRMSTDGSQYCFWRNNVAQTCVVRRFAQTQAAVTGETHNRSSQMPGTSTGQEIYTSATLNGGTVFVYNSSPVITAGPGNFHRQSAQSGTEFHIWDTCSP